MLGDPYRAEKSLAQSHDDSTVLMLGYTKALYSRDYFLSRRRRIRRKTRSSGDLQTSAVTMATKGSQS